eukprot:gene380-447_t
MSLDANTIAIIKSTIPVLGSVGPALTTHFYERLFKHNPELKNVFNMNNQRNGDQSQALFNAIVAYASNIENLAVLLPAVEKIAQKHASINVKPEHYAVVGEHLIATIDELAHPGQAVLDAWTAAYNVLADVFIGREKAIYTESAAATGGWSGIRDFKIVQKEVLTEQITAFTLAPVDGAAVAAYLPGQYIAVHISHESLEFNAIRQYSLTTQPNGSTYRIAVKREDKGDVSTYLHTIAKEGDIVRLSPPHGDFFLDVDVATPVTLISAGVGQTPLLSMLHTLNSRGHTAPVQWLHAAHSEQFHAFASEVTTLGQKLSSFEAHVWLSEAKPDLQATTYNTHSGRIDLANVPAISTTAATHFYFCGPVGFMQNVAKQLTDRGVAPERLHYECFGPNKVL